MDILQCPVCGEPLTRDPDKGEAGFDCANGCRARDPEAWVRARWEQLHRGPSEG